RRMGRQRRARTKPRVAQRTLGCEERTPGISATLKGLPNVWELIPNISLVVFQLVFSEQPAEFVLKRFAPMVFFLVSDVALERFDMRRTYGKRTVATLPMKPCELGTTIGDHSR